MNKGVIIGVATLVVGLLIGCGGNSGSSLGVLNDAEAAIPKINVSTYTDYDNGVAGAVCGLGEVAVGASCDCTGNYASNTAGLLYTCKTSFGAGAIGACSVDFIGSEFPDALPPITVSVNCLKLTNTTSGKPSYKTAGESDFDVLIERERERHLDRFESFYNKQSL